MTTINELVNIGYNKGYMKGLIDGGLAGAKACQIMLDNATSLPEIKTVIFNEPATIVFWEDNTKTVVKAQCGEPFDKEKGLAMAIIKKMFDNNGSYYEIFHKYCPEESERTK